MNTKWLETFKNLPFEKKEEIFNRLSEAKEKATDDNDGAKINRIEKNLVRALVKSWDGTSTKAINKALKTFPKNDKRFTQKDADKVLRSLDSSYKNVEKKTASRVEDDLEDVYKTNKVQFGRKFKIDSKEKAVIFKGVHFDPMSKTLLPLNKQVKSIQWKEGLADIFKAVEFGAIDAYAYENLARLQNVAIGDHFPKTLKPKVNKILQDALDQGLNHADTSLMLEQELTKTLGGNIQAAVPASVAQGQAATSAYFEMLTATQVTYSRNFSQTQLMVEGGIEQIIFQAIVDNLTSQVCSQMDGRVFTIEHAVQHRQKVLEADDVAQLQSIAPFQRNLDSFGLSAGQDLTNPKTADALAKAGVIVPPLHPRCRSELHPL